MALSSPSSLMIGTQISARSSPYLFTSTRLHSLTPLRPLASLSARPSVQRWRVIARAEETAKNSPISSSLRTETDADDAGDYKDLMDGSGNCDPLCSVDDVSSQDFEASYQPKTDLLKALAILASALAGAVAINHYWVTANQDVAMALMFALGYAGIFFEESLAFNKSGVGLLMAVCLWVIRSIGVGAFGLWKAC